MLRVQCHLELRLDLPTVCLTVIPRSIARCKTQIALPRVHRLPSCRTGVRAFDASNLLDILRIYDSTTTRDTAPHRAPVIVWAMAAGANGTLVQPQDAVRNCHLPPKPVGRPGRVRVVRALYKYNAQNVDELSFEEGQLLYVQEHETDPNWWRAKSDSKEGLIPANYVQEQMEEVEMPLHEAARRGNISNLKECLKQGVSATGLDSAGNTALYWASRTGHVDCVKELLSLRNPPLDAQNRMGDTPLHVAANHGHLDIVELLLAAGADASLENNGNLRAEELASSATIKNMLQMCRRRYDSSTHGYGVDDYENDDSD